MSEWKVQVVKVGKLEKHANADRLLITKVFDYPVITAVGENYQEGELAVYVPVDSVVPADDPRWTFLQGHNRIKAKRLRGVFSMGLLAKPEPGMQEGEIVAERMRITKYEPPIGAVIGGEAEACPFDWPKYTDIESVRRWPDILTEGEEVVMTEKIHGTSARYVWQDGRLWVGSHNEIKKEIPGSVYWKAASYHHLAKRLESIPGIALYGEVYGWIQDLRYGHRAGDVSLALFDAMDLKTRRYLDYDAFERLAEMLEVPIVPIIYRGPWKNDLKTMAEGNTMLGKPYEFHEPLDPRDPSPAVEPIDQIREGFVVKPVKERFDDRIQRVILKYHGEGYLTRKEKD